MARRYEQTRRAESREETRRRIVEAAIELHSTIGPARTTVSEIAERAGVGRVTVYRHFPDEAALARRCSGTYLGRNPFPDPAGWEEVADPGERFLRGVRESFAWYAANRAMIGRVLADARDHEAMAPYHAHWDAAAAVLAAPFRARGARAGAVRAAVALALSFDTWRTLVAEQGLRADRAAELLLRLVPRD